MYKHEIFIPLCCKKRSLSNIKAQCSCKMDQNALNTSIVLINYQTDKKNIQNKQK